MSPLCQHSTVANVEIVTGAGASLVTLCPNELYAKQIPPILRSHGERPGEGGSAGQKHGDIYINTEYSGLRNKKSIFHPAQSSGESLRTSSAGTGGDGWSRPEIETRPSILSSICLMKDEIVLRES